MAPFNLPSLKRFGLTVLEFFLPRLCLFCGAGVGEEAAQAICPECEAQIDWVKSPLCPGCGRMFASPDGGDRPCGDCQTEPPPFDRARAAAVYDGLTDSRPGHQALQVQPPNRLSAAPAKLAAAPGMSGPGDRSRPALAGPPAPPAPQGPGLQPGPAAGPGLSRINRWAWRFSPGCAIPCPRWDSTPRSAGTTSKAPSPCPSPRSEGQEDPAD